MKIKIVVDIEKKKYENIIKKFQTFPKEMKEWGLEEIKNGKPLEQESVLDKIEEEIKALFKEPAYYIPNYDAYKKVLGIINKYKPESEVEECEN